MPSEPDTKRRQENLIPVPILDFGEIDAAGHGRSIFIFETDGARTELSARALCAAESAAAANPGRTVFLLLSMPTDIRGAPAWLSKNGALRLRRMTRRRC